MERQPTQKINKKSQKHKRKKQRISYITQILFYAILCVVAILSTVAFLFLRDLAKQKLDKQASNTITHLTVADTKVPSTFASETEVIEATEEEQSIIVVLDAGHGGIDGGTYYKEVLEKDINLAITLYLADALAKQDLEIILTRSEDEYLTLEDRAYIANKENADLFVSIHCNYYEGKETVSGIECYYYPKSKDGKQCAEILTDILKEEHTFKVRSPKSDDYYVLENTDMTAVLVEVGYISDKKERQNLTSKDYQLKLAEKLAEGIMASLEMLKTQNE